MYGRLMAREVWEHLGYDVDEAISYVETSEIMAAFRKMLFTRIVPIVKDIGLFGPKVKACFEDLNVIDFQDLDPESMSASDEQIAEEMDRRRAEIMATAAVGAAD